MLGGGGDGRVGGTHQRGRRGGHPGEGFPQSSRVLLARPAVPAEDFRRLPHAHQPALRVCAAGDPGLGHTAEVRECGQQERPCSLGRPFPQQAVGGSRTLQLDHRW